MEQVDLVLRPGDQGALRQEAAAEAPALFVRFLCPRGAGHQLPWVVQPVRRPGFSVRFCLQLVV